MPRKSAAAIAVVPRVSPSPPALRAPARLSAAELAVWNRTIALLPLGWCPSESVEVAVTYVAHVAAADRLRALAREADNPRDVAALLREARCESNAALTHARALRLTPNSRLNHTGAGRRAAAAPATAPIEWDEHFAQREPQP